MLFLHLIVAGCLALATVLASQEGDQDDDRPTDVAVDEPALETDDDEDAAADSEDIESDDAQLDDDESDAPDEDDIAPDDARPDADESDSPAADGPDSGDSNADEPDLTDFTNRCSYYYGMQIGRSLKAQNLEIDAKVLLAGILDVFEDREPRLSQEECQTLLEELQATQVDRAKKQGDKNMAEGEKFLAANRAKQGVKSTKSGLQYKVLKSGKGKSPGPTDVVTTHYKGTFLDGKVFDSSYDRGEPAQFPVNRVIPGWTEALQMMKVGDKWQLFIPSKLAYGPRGQGSDIPPNATLIFEVELLGIGEGE